MNLSEARIGMFVQLTCAVAQVNCANIGLAVQQTSDDLNMDFSASSHPIFSLLTFLNQLTQNLATPLFLRSVMKTHDTNVAMLLA